MLTAHLATVEILFVLLAYMTGTLGPQPSETEWHRGVYVTSDEPDKSGDRRAPEVFDAAKLNYERAKALDGKRITVRVRLISIEGTTHGERMLYSCRVEGNDNFWVLFFDDNRPKDDQLKGELFVEGQLKAYPSEQISGKEMPAQVVLTESKIVKR
jgi:hypothetical protein